MHYFPGENWYALRVKYQYEAIAQKTLSAKRFSPLHLTYKALSRRRDRKKAIVKAFFPGYMFIRSEMNAEIHVEILKSLGVVEVLRNSKGPIPIPDSQIENISRLQEYEGKIVSFSEFATGMPVKIVQGPLKGVIGFVDNIERDLVKIGVESIPSSVAINVSPAQIEPLEKETSFSNYFKFN